MIPFSPPRIDQKIIDEVVDTLKSGWITTGPKTKLFEKRLTAYCGNKVTLCLNSATAGLELILRWFGITEGDEVIVPAYTYSATANVVIHCGATPVFVDVGSDFNISIDEIEKSITGKTKAIMPVDIGGYPCDYDAIHELINRKEIKTKFRANIKEQKSLGRLLTLSDAAHSLGATYNGKKTGSLTDISVFSFHAVKNLTTAEGGAVALNLPGPFDNESIYQELCVKSLHGQNKDALAKMQRGNWRYDIVEAGYKCNMTDLFASMGIIELERYESDTLKKRKWICEKYSEAFSKYTWAIIPRQKEETRNKKQETETARESSYHLFPLRIKGITESQRDEIIQKIFEKGVSVNVHFIPVPMMSFYKSLGYDIRHYPRTYELYSSEISIPVFYDLTEEMIRQVIEAVIKSVEEVI